MKKIKTLVITGPTAVGKSALALEIAQKLNLEIISADSVQVYKKLKIGSSKPTQEELDIVPHHCIDLLSLMKSLIPHYLSGMQRR